VAGARPLRGAQFGAFLAVAHRDQSVSPSAGAPGIPSSSQAANRAHAAASNRTNYAANSARASGNGPDSSSG
jgi:hypothetical protein